MKSENAESRTTLTEVTDRDRELAAYWTERGDLRSWIAVIIAATRRAERYRCAEIAEMVAPVENMQQAIADRIRNAK